MSKLNSPTIQVGSNPANKIVLNTPVQKPLQERVGILTSQAFVEIIDLDENSLWMLLALTLLAQCWPKLIHRSRLLEGWANG